MLHSRLLRKRCRQADDSEPDVTESFDGAFESLGAYEELLGDLNSEQMYAVAAKAIDGNNRRYIRPPLHAAAVAGMVDGTICLEETLNYYFLWWNYEEYLWKTRLSLEHHTDLDVAKRSQASDEKDKFDGRAYEIVRTLFDSTPYRVLGILMCSTSTLSLSAKWADRHDHALTLIPRPISTDQLPHFGPMTMTDDEAVRRAELWRLYLYYLNVVRHSLRLNRWYPETYGDFFDDRVQVDAEIRFALDQGRKFQELARRITPGKKIREFLDAMIVCKRACESYRKEAFGNV